MPDRELIDFIKQELQEGAYEEDIGSNLLAEGVSSEDLDEAFDEAYLELDSQAATVKPDLFEKITGKKNLGFILFYFAGLAFVIFLLLYIKGFNFTLPSISTELANLTVKKCEFAKNLGNFTLEFVKTEKGNDDFSRKYRQNYMTRVQYGVNPDAWSTMMLGTYASESYADQAWQEQLNRAPNGIKDCEIENIKGVCQFITPKISQKTKGVSSSFYWKERNTIRNIIVDTTTETGSLANTVAEKEKVADDSMKLFLSVARDCNIDTKEDYIAPHVKRMSF